VKSQQVKQIGEKVEREGEREREQQITGVRDGALDRIGNGAGFVKMDT
jgi:hypothetical protein